MRNDRLVVSQNASEYCREKILDAQRDYSVHASMDFGVSPVGGNGVWLFNEFLH